MQKYFYTYFRMLKYRKLPDTKHTQYKLVKQKTQYIADKQNDNISRIKAQSTRYLTLNNNQNCMKTKRTPLRLDDLKKKHRTM